MRMTGYFCCRVPFRQPAVTLAQKRIIIYTENAMQMTNDYDNPLNQMTLHD
jgi:hypothetical protein